ncbi:hypothetical protein B0H10DRAFT_1967618 [Mycena sp. CBHHK59/15]|nr:hypothetical protein B0H10DRAFT_1967618 [Mycena sp. CBHHK59/15]
MSNPKSIGATYCHGSGFSLICSTQISKKAKYGRTWIGRLPSTSGLSFWATTLPVITFASIDANFQLKKSSEIAVDDEESDDMPALIPDFTGYHGCSCACYGIRRPIVKSKL